MLHMPKILIFQILVLLSCTISSQSYETNLTTHRWPSLDGLYNLIQYPSTDQLKQLPNQHNSEKYKYLMSFEAVHFTIEQQAEFHGRAKLPEALLATISAQLHSFAYNYMHLHQYDNYQQVVAASGPSVDSKLCAQHLLHLCERAGNFSASASASNDIELFRFLNSFGRITSGALAGNVFSIGHYKQCIGMQLPPGDGLESTMSTKFCIARLRHPSWPSELVASHIAIELGVCLPSYCDSTNRLGKLELVDKLVKLNDPLVDVLGLNVTGLYCLPDEDSTMRSLLHSKEALATILFLTSWMAFLIYATIKHSSDPNATSFKSLSLSHNFRSLFETTTCNESNAHGVNLSLIDGIKVIGLVHLIMGHVLLIISNGTKDNLHWASSSIFSVVGPATTVSVFFAITGMLTSYTVFIRDGNLNGRFITNPKKWTSYISLRYMRIISVYLVFILYSKSLAKHLNSGPLWDYGTSSLSPRYKCEQEPWYWTILLLINFKQPQDGCFLAGWHLANNFHFLLITPLLLILLAKCPKMSGFLISIGVMSSYFANSYVIWSHPSDVRPVVRLEQHSFYIIMNHPLYTRPIYRIMTYLMGVYYGHVLFKRRSLDEPDKKQEEPVNRSFSKIDKMFFAVMLLMSGAKCLIGQYLWLDDSYARVVAAVMLPFMQFLPSLVICIFIVERSSQVGRCKDFLARFLESSYWKPLSKLSFCAMLANVEVLGYIVQGQSYLHYLSEQYLCAITLFSVVVTYVVATLMHVTIEAPLRYIVDKIHARVSDMIAHLFKKKQH